MISNASNKVCIITGASSGMGKGTALYLAEKGMASAITLFARRQELLEELANSMKDKFPSVKTLVVVGDASKAEDNKRMVDETVAAFGALHGIFINAGVYAGGTPIHDTPDDVIDKNIDVNIKGVIYGMRYAIPAIKTTVGEEGPTGSIVVNSSTMAASVIGPKSIGSSMYSASKAFCNSLVETAAIENAPRIRVNTVMPGLVQTNTIPVDEATYDVIAKDIQPLWGRAGKPAEVAALVAFLLSDEASLISGTHIKADGLWSMAGGAFPEQF